MKKIITLSCLLFSINQLSAQLPYNVKDIDTSASTSSVGAPIELINMNGTLFFAANDGTNGYNNVNNLWKSDGTTAGTVIVNNSVNISNFSMITINSTLFFQSYSTTPELWKSDGTIAGTVLIKQMPYAFGNMTNMNGTLYFLAQDASYAYELWKSDGTTAGTVLLKSGLGINPTEMVVMNNNLYFNGRDGAAGNAIWKSDGTTSGTTVVMDNPGGALITNLTTINNTLFFVNTNGSGAELWKTDGTSGGTVIIKDIRSGSASSSPANLININGTLYFSANDGVNGIELWKSDGTAIGTTMIKDINSGSGSSNPGNFTNVNNKLFFTAADGYGMELWSSDGTGAGTALIKDINTTFLQGSSPSYLTNVNGTLYFNAYNGNSFGMGLWKSDGTGTGTVLVENIDSTIDRSNLQIGGLTAVNNNLFFTMLNTNIVGSLWSLNGINLALVPPTNLSAIPTRNTSREITLNWQDNSTNETGFKIERSLNGIGWSVINSVAANVTSYADSIGLSNATTYYYRVNAYNVNGSSTYSNTVNVTSLTGINPISGTTASVSIYPNPFKNFTTLKINSTLLIKNAELKIYDVLGKEIKNISSNTNEINIDRNGLENGIYFYKLINNNFLLTTGKFIVN